jgi:hypothetical protein
MWQDASYRRLALALGFSLLLHLFLIGRFGFSLPELNDQHDLIEARLVLSKAVIETVSVKSAADNKPVKKPVVLPKPAPNKEASSAEKLSTAETIPTPQIIEEPPLPSAAVVVDAVKPLLVNQFDDSGLINNPKPYQYIETNFDVYTDKEPTLNSSVAGNAKMVYQILPNGERYQIRSLIQAKGLAALLIPDLLQTSDGYWDKTGLQPTHYLYQFGDKRDKTFSADFEWESKKLTLHSEKGDQLLDFTNGTQDLLSFMYQFMFVPPLQNMQLSITNGKKLGVYDYSFEGEETIVTKMGDLRTIHLLRMAPEGEKRTELWLALDYQHVPVKIRETDKEGKVYELLATSLKTELPAAAQ